MHFPIPIFFISTVLFVSYLAFKRNKQTKNQERTNEAFLERERHANSTRRKDISNLNYLRISLETLPIAEYDDEELYSHEAILQKLCQKNILNLSMYSNTDLKLMYGPANLEELSACDENYHTLSSTLSAYAKRETALSRPDAAIAILEYAMVLHIDNSQIYLLLADLYKQQNTPEKIQNIIDVLSKMEADEFEHSFASRLLPKIREFLF